MFLPFPSPAARILQFTRCPAAQRGALTSWQPEHWVESLSELKFAFSIQLHFLSLEQRSREQSLLMTHCSSILRQKTAAEPLFFPFLSREKVIYHLRRLTVLTIFQPFWHRFFWNCLKTSATLVALFRCTSRESFRSSDAWTFTILEGWTRQAKRKKVLKEGLLSVKTLISKIIWRAWRIKLVQTAVQRAEAGSSHTWKHQGEHYALVLRGALCSPSACAGALCCSNTALTQPRWKQDLSEGILANCSAQF